MIFPLFLYFFNFLNFLPLFPGAIIDDAAAVRRIITSVCPRNYNPTFPPVVVKNKVTVFFFTRVQFSRFDAPACRTLARICNIGEGRWSTRSRRARGGLGIDCGECGRWASGRTRRVSWSRRSALCPILCPGGDRRSSRRYLSSAENKRRKRGKLIEESIYVRLTKRYRNTHRDRANRTTSSRFRGQRIVAGYRANSLFAAKLPSGVAGARGAWVRMPSRSFRMRSVRVVHAESATSAHLWTSIIMSISLSTYNVRWILLNFIIRKYIKNKKIRLFNINLL